MSPFPPDALVGLPPSNPHPRALVLPDRVIEALRELEADYACPVAWEQLTCGVCGGALSAGGWCLPCESQPEVDSDQDEYARCAWAKAAHEP